MPVLAYVNQVDFPLALLTFMLSAASLFPRPVTVWWFKWTHSCERSGSLLMAMTPFVLRTTAARTRIIPSWLFGFPWGDNVFRQIEIHSPRGLRHSRGIFVNEGVFFCLRCRYVNREKLCPEVCSIGTHLCHEANDVGSIEGQRSCTGLVVYLFPVNWMVVLL